MFRTLTTRPIASLSSAAILPRLVVSSSPFASSSSSSSSSAETATSSLMNKPSQQQQRLEGVITKWHFIERCGEIEVLSAADQQQQQQSNACNTINNNNMKHYLIRNAQSFETIMPTQHRSLVGTKVSFTPIIEPDPKAESEIIRSAIGITMDLATTPESKASSASVLMKESELNEKLLGEKDPEADVIARVRQQQQQSTDRTKEPTQNPPTYGNIDLRAETLFAPGGFLSCGSGPSYSGPKMSGTLTKKERRPLGDSGMTLEGNLVRVEAPAGFFLQGEIVAWSGITRTGLIRIPSEKEDDGRDVQYAISNVEAFVSAMPSSIALRGATVQFRPVHMHAVENADEVVRGGGAEKIKLGKVVLSLAETIEVMKLPVSPSSSPSHVETNDGSGSIRMVTAAEEAKRRKEKMLKEWMKKSSSSTSGGGGEDDDVEPAPVGLQYGVITRWSGGQGIIEASTTRTFLIDSAKDFSTYFDVSNMAVRGAVVEFLVPKDHPRYAVHINILSDMNAAREAGSVVQTSVPLSNLPFSLSVEVSDSPHKSNALGMGTVRVHEENELVEESQPPPQMQQQRQPQSEEEAALLQQHISKQAVSDDHQSSEKSNNKKSRYGDIDLASLPVRTGVLVSYSAAECQGVVKDQTSGERFLLRDTRQDVQDFAKVKPMLARGCILEFRVVGSSGRLAAFAELTMLANGEAPATVDADELDEQENRVGGLAALSGGTNSDEAVAGPMSMTYWVTRFEKVGANMNEFKNFQQQAMVPGQMPKDEQGKEMPEDLRKTDAWFNDSDKNRKIPGTKHRFSDLMQYNQMGMVEMSHTIKDPAKLHTKMKDLEDKVPAEMREKGMQKARDFGPKYLKAIHEAQKRGGEPNFNFSG